MAKKERESKDTSSRKHEVPKTTPDWFPPPKRQKNHHKNDIFPTNLEHYFDDVRPEDLPLYTSLSLISLMLDFGAWESTNDDGYMVDDDYDPNEIDLEEEEPQSFPEYLDKKELSAAYGSHITVRLMTETATGHEPKIAVNPFQARMLSNLFSVDLTDYKKRYIATVNFVDHEGNVVEQLDLPLERRSVYARDYGTVFISAALADKKGDLTLEIVNVFSDKKKVNLDEDLSQDHS